MSNKAPNFKIPSTNSKLLELKKIKSKYKVLYFYPKDSTPGCTKEGEDFRDLYKKFIKSKLGYNFSSRNDCQN